MSLKSSRIQVIRRNSLKKYFSEKNYNHKVYALENSGTSTIITPPLLATPCPQGSAQTQKSSLGPACRSDSAGRDLGVSYIVGYG